MDRVTQREEERYQEGRRDAFKNSFCTKDDPIYLAGWREGMLERMTLQKEESNDTA